MTNEQAIEVINGHIKDSSVAYGTFTGQALHMAVEALKAQLSREGTTKDATSATSSTADTISQQTAVELVMKYCPDDDGAVQCDGDIRELLDELENLPLTQSEPKWIPCGETVDIPDHEVMACDRCGEFIIGYLDYKDEQWICESDSCLMYDPVAWCELPEPYKEGGMKSEGSEDA